MLYRIRVQVMGKRTQKWYEEHRPTTSDLSAIPRWGLVALAARSARRALPMLNAPHFDDKNNMDETYGTYGPCIEAAETAAMTGRTVKELSPATNRSYKLAANTPGPADYPGSIDNASDYNYMVNCQTVGHAIAQACESSFKSDVKSSRKHAVLAIQNSYGWGPGFSTVEGIWADIELLKAATRSENWTDNTPVAPQFFSPDSVIERRVMLAINDLCVRLCELIAEDAKAIEYIDWRLLEQVVASALDGIGFEVTLTPGNKDGGKDVIAACTLRGKKVIYYLEIKHWRSNKRVGPHEVSHFVEVNVKDGTDGGLFLSSSGFAQTVFAQLSEITQRRITLGNDVKIISLCQRFVQQRQQAIWQRKDVLPEILFEHTLSSTCDIHII